LLKADSGLAHDIQHPCRQVVSDHLPGMRRDREAGMSATTAHVQNKRLRILLGAGRNIL